MEVRLIERKRLRIENDKRQSKAEMSTWSPTGNSDVSSEVGVLTLRRPHITPAPGETSGLPPGTRTSRPRLAFLHFADHTSPSTVRDARAPTGNSDVASEVGVLTLRRPHITPAPCETTGLPPGTRTSRPKLAFLHFAGHASPHHRARRPGSSGKPCTSASATSHLPHTHLSITND